MSTESKQTIGYKSQVSSAAVLALIGWIIYTMATNNMIVWLDWTDGGFKLTVGILVFTACLVVGIEKPAVMGTLMAIMNVIFNPRMDMDSKILFIKEAIEKLIGIGIVVQSQINQTKIEEPKAVEKVVEKKLELIPEKKVEKVEKPIESVKAPTPIIVESITPIKPIPN